MTEDADGAVIRTGIIANADEVGRAGLPVSEPSRAVVTVAQGRTTPGWRRRPGIRGERE